MAAIICREMGWTLQEYQNTPVEFVDNIYLMLIEEATARKKAERMPNR